MDRVLFDTPVGPMALECEGECLTALYLPCRPVEGAGAETPLLARGRAENQPRMARYCCAFMANSFPGAVRRRSLFQHTILPAACQIPGGPL